MIDVADLAVSFGDVAVLEGVDLAIERGDFVGLVGPNGAGKTSLLRTINGVISPDAGTVNLGDESVSTLRTRAVSRRVATVPQETNLGFAFTAEQIVEMGRTPHHSRLDWSTDDEPVARAMARTETAHLADRPVEDLSGGERQRVLVARALAQDAPALLLDEPTASLDINHQVRVLDLARNLAGDGHAVLAAIHDLDLAARFCDRLAMLHAGVVAAEGPPEQVLASGDLDDAFGTETVLHTHPATGAPSVAAVSREQPRGAAVHVTGHGEPAARVLGVLWEAGFDASVGVVPDGDVAASAARSLDLPVVASDPFSDPASSTVDRAASLLGAADVCLRVNDGQLPVGGSGPGPPVVDLEVPDGSNVTRQEVLDAVLAGLERRPVPADD
ncbi:MAG: heme ABC transporter ATP-binding protein [Haloarculaceae archaeon]